MPLGLVGPVSPIVLRKQQAELGHSEMLQIGKRSYKRLANSSTQRSLLRNDGRMCRRRKGPTGLEETEREEKGRREEQVTSGFEHRL